MELLGIVDVVETEEHVGKDGAGILEGWVAVAPKGHVCATIDRGAHDLI